MFGRTPDPLVVAVSLQRLGFAGPLSRTTVKLTPGAPTGAPLVVLVVPSAVAAPAEAPPAATQPATSPDNAIVLALMRIDAHP